MHHNISVPDSYLAPSNHLENKRILLLGGATDLGHHIALSLAKHGAEMILPERKERLISTLYDEITEQGSIEPLAVAFDINKASTELFYALAGSLGSEVGHLDAVICLATNAAPLSPVTLSKPDIWQSFFETIVVRHISLLSALLPLLEKAEKPAVILPGMSCGHDARAYWGPVGAAFAALDNACETLALENKNIRFNTLSPGKVNSAVRHKYYPAEAKSKSRECDDPFLLNHYHFLVSDECEWSGRHLRVPDKD